MRRLIRSPLTWLVAAELAVVGALVVVAWNVVASAGRPAVVLPVVQAPDPTDDSAAALPEVPNLNTPRVRGPLPGLNLDSDFWRGRLSQLNEDQVLLEHLEWQIVHSAEVAVSHYVETVVLPAIRNAEHAGGGSVV